MTLLDIANYGLFADAGAFLATLGKVLLGGVGFIMAAVVLTFWLIAAIIGIGVHSVNKGIRRRSVPRTVGTFFRLTGIALGVFVSLLLLPAIALLFGVSVLKLLVVAAVLIVIGYFTGRMVSKLIGLRMLKYVVYIRTIDNLRSKIVRLVYYR